MDCKLHIFINVSTWMWMLVSAMLDGYFWPKKHCYFPAAAAAADTAAPIQSHNSSSFSLE